MIVRIVSYVLVLSLLIVGALAEEKSFPEPSAFVLRLDDDGKDYLVKFGLNTDEIRNEILLQKGNSFNNFVVDEVGGCYISDYCAGGSYGRGIYYYNPFEKTTHHFVHLKDNFGPRYLALTKDKLIVEVNGDDETRVWGGVLFIDRKTKEINKFLLKKKDFKQVNIDDIYLIENKYLFLTTLNYNAWDIKRDRCGNIHVIDVDKGEIITTINIPDQYKFNDGIICANNKIYLAPGGIYDPTNIANDRVGTNYDILVFSRVSGEMLKKIKVSGHPYKLAYDPSVQKIYVQHMSDSQNEGDIVEIIDAKTDKIMGELKIPSLLMFSLVKPGKMYITVGDMFLSPTKTEPGLLVLDTKTDKIIKRINGNYKGISVNNFIY